MAGIEEQRRRRLERLRKLGVQRGVEFLARAARPETQAPPLNGRVHGLPADENDFLPGAEVQTELGPAWVREVRYPLDRFPDLALWLGVTPETLAALDHNDALLDLDPARAVFIDTETTGLSIGGTYTFLIGIGYYDLPAVTDPDCDECTEPGAFVVRQIFMRHPGEEAAQLRLVDDALLGASGIVSFNGRAFDMPLINSRFVLNSMSLPLVGAPHLDLLPPARRLWKMRWGSCSLGNLERNVLGLQRTGEDVPGYLIPEIYRQYYLSGVATEMLGRVFYHNLQDIVSMALLGARMARCFHRDALDPPPADLDPLECVSLGRCYDALGWVEASVRYYRFALERSGPGSQVIALRELSLLYKRLEWRDEAAQLWEEWVTTVTGEDLTPYVELAKHHEWHTGNLAAARGWAAWALRIAKSQPPGLARDETVGQLRHRLARIERKLGGALEDGEEE